MLRRWFCSVTAIFRTSCRSFFTTSYCLMLWGKKYLTARIRIVLSEWSRHCPSWRKKRFHPILRLSDGIWGKGKPQFWVLLLNILSSHRCLMIWRPRNVPPRWACPHSEPVLLWFWQKITDWLIRLKKPYRGSEMQAYGFPTMWLISLKLKQESRIARQCGQIVKTLSKELTAEFGKGFSTTNIQYFRQFYLTSPDSGIRHSKTSDTVRRIRQSE